MRVTSLMAGTTKLKTQGQECQATVYSPASNRAARERDCQVADPPQRPRVDGGDQRAVSPAAAISYSILRVFLNPL